MKTAIWWIRRDLRISDNQALSAAIRQAEQVLPVFILDSRLLNSPYAGPNRSGFLYEGLRALDHDLRSRGSYLIVRRGDPIQAMLELIQTHGVEKVFAEEDYSPFAQRRDHKAGLFLPLQLTSGMAIHPPAAVVKPDGTPYRVFTPFSKAWKAFPWPGGFLPAPERIQTPTGIATEDIPAVPEGSKLAEFPAGEDEAQRRLAAFIDQSILDYESDRNRVDLDGTSSLSPYLRFGMLSARQAAVSAKQAQQQVPDETWRRGAETWFNQLIWRDFMISILHHFPYVRQTAFRPRLRNIRWINNPQDFAAWTEGRTGYPVVDAALRQLLNTGWMHNRARMISASFLVKDLLVDWRWGEQFFMQHLIDGDPALNNGGWQWTAGTGLDAAPYFRIFNPVSQGEKHDPEGAYVRRWVPELKDVPTAYIHSPWLMPSSMQQAAGCVIGKHYPAPIVDHALARERALAAYRSA